MRLLVSSACCSVPVRAAPGGSQSPLLQVLAWAAKGHANRALPYPRTPCTPFGAETVTRTCARVEGRDFDIALHGLMLLLARNFKPVFVRRSEGTVVTGGDDGDMGAPAEQWYGNDRGGGGGGGGRGGRGEDFNW